MEMTTAEQNNLNKQDLKPFSYVNGKINVIEFLEATSSLIKVIERLGKAFAPVKYDMEGNVEKIKKYYKYDNNSCLLELMAEEYTKGKSEAAEGILWLNRALLFFELIFQQIIVSLQTNNNEVDMNKIYNMAYEGSVKKYHNWITQQLFALICKVAPNFTQILKSFEGENNLNQFEEKLTNFNSTLHPVRTKIDDFFKERNMFSD